MFGWLHDEGALDIDLQSEFKRKWDTLDQNEPITSSISKAAEWKPSNEKDDWGTTTYSNYEEWQIKGARGVLKLGAQITSSNESTEAEIQNEKNTQ